jgi:UDP-GlcNAc:undecaprenyl-phosphate GlcNAc-1-phosphate transferase
MIYLLITVFVASIIFISLLIKYADRLGFVDIPNDRSSHQQAMPRSAGIGFVLAVILSFFVMDFSFFMEYIHVFIALGIMLFAGILDDKFNISPKVKFSFILVATLLLCFNDIYISSLGECFGYELTLPLLLAFPFTFFAVAGFTNALNLVDGLDGLAGSIALVMFGAFFAIGWINQDTLMINLSAAFMSTLVAFLFFNWFPAKIFMGDSGSLTLGFAIALLSILSLKYVTPSAVLFLIGLPLYDTFIVMRRRMQRGKSPFSADKNHLHHLLYNIKLDVKFTITMFIYMQIVFSIIGFQMRDANNTLTLVLFVLFFYIFLNLFDQRLRYRKKKDKNRKFKKLLKHIRGVNQ